MTQRITTSSEIGSWVGCRMRWWFRYHEHLVPLKPQAPLSFGSLCHAGLEALYLGLNSFGVMCTYIDENDNPWNSAETQFIIQSAVTLIEGYMLHDPIKAMGHTVEAVEEEFIVPLRSPAGRRYKSYMFAGKKDLKTRDRHGNKWLTDHKTSAMALNPEHLPLDDQMGFYIWAESQTGDAPVGIIYNLIRKPTSDPKEVPVLDNDGLPIVLDEGGNRAFTKSGTPRKVGGTGFIAQKRPETPEEWGKRLREDIESRPKFYYDHELVVKSRQDLAKIESDLWRLAHDIGKGHIYRNPRSCKIMGCAYRELCKCDSYMNRKASYRIERPHIELSEVV